LELIRSPTRGSIVKQWVNIKALMLLAFSESRVKPRMVHVLALGRRASDVEAAPSRIAWALIDTDAAPRIAVDLTHFHPTYLDAQGRAESGDLSRERR
jgi:hypothetical protein